MILIATIVLELLKILYFWDSVYIKVLIINRLVYNVLSHNPIVFKFSQKKNILLSFASLQSFEIIPTSGNNFMDQNLKHHSSL